MQNRSCSFGMAKRCADKHASLLISHVMCLLAPHDGLLYVCALAKHAVLCQALSGAACMALKISCSMSSRALTGIIRLQFKT